MPSSHAYPRLQSQRTSWCRSHWAPRIIALRLISSQFGPAPIPAWPATALSTVFIRTGDQIVKRKHITTFYGNQPFLRRIQDTRCRHAARFLILPNPVQRAIKRILRQTHKKSPTRHPATTQQARARQYSQQSQTQGGTLTQPTSVFFQQTKAFYAKLLKSAPLPDGDPVHPSLYCCRSRTHTNTTNEKFS